MSHESLVMTHSSMKVIFLACYSAGKLCIWEAHFQIGGSGKSMK